MKNKLPDLNNHLFAQLERLSEEDLDAEKIEAEVKRSEAIVNIAEQVISGMRMQLDAVKVVASHGDRMGKMMPLLVSPTEYADGSGSGK